MRVWPRSPRQVGDCRRGDIACRRPPTIDEAVDWLTKMQHMPDYRRSCLTFLEIDNGYCCCKAGFGVRRNRCAKWINDRGP